MMVDASGIMFHLPCFDLFQKISDLPMIGQSNLNAHRVQALHRRLSHASTDEELTIAQIVELSHMRGIAAHAMMMLMVVVVIVIMMMVMMLTSIWKLPQFLVHNLTLIQGNHQKRPGLAKMTGNGHTIVGRNRNFDCHLTSTKKWLRNDPLRSQNSRERGTSPLKRIWWRLKPIEKQNLIKKEHPRRDSNPQPTVPKTVALAIELRGRVMSKV